MYHSLIGSLTRAGIVYPVDERKSLKRSTPRALAQLSDHQLRDIGFVRERTFPQRVYLFWA